jgi:hypothetical protein
VEWREQEQEGAAQTPGVGTREPGTSVTQPSRITPRPAAPRWMVGATAAVLAVVAVVAVKITLLAA